MLGGPSTRLEFASGLRSGPLPSAERDASGNIYVVWQDCRFRATCDANDLVISTSSNGLSWTEPQRIPIDPVDSPVDHFIPGLGVDPNTSGGRAHLALAYYFYPDSTCTPQTCQLDVGYVTSSDGGATWSPPSRLNPSPMSLEWLASTTQGQMVGDYMSTSFVNSGPVTVFALARTPDTTLHESMYAAVLKLRPGAAVANSRSNHPQSRPHTNRLTAH